MNKKWPALFLAMLLLCGCSTKEETAPTSPEAPAATHRTPEPTESVGFYQPESILEVSTGGAIKTYPLNITDAAGIRFLGEDILLFSGNDNTTLTLLSGTQRYIKAQRQLDCPVSPEDPAVVVSAHGLTYADRADQALVFLNAQLQEVSRISLPETCHNIVLSQDRRLLYYCTPESLRVLDLESGVDRLLKEMQFPRQELVALHWADTVLQCNVTHDDGSQRCFFFRAEDGSLLTETREEIPLWTANDLYFTTHMDGTYLELITGSSASNINVLVPDQKYTAMEPALDSQGILMYRQTEDGRTVLDWYQLDSGICSAQEVLPGPYHPRGVQSDPSTNTIWFLCYDNLTEQDLLCAWSLDASATKDDICYLQPRYTRENPDLEGLEECKLQALRISIKHNVQVLIWEDAAAFQPWDYTLVPEYQVPLIREKLAELDEILSAYPEGFLKEAASQTSSSRLTICLVRTINGNPDTNALPSAAGLQFWNHAAEAYLAITPSTDMAQHIYHELFHIIDSRVLSSCNAYDNWNSLNPKGFSYDSSYASNSSRNQAYLTGENRYFIDLYSTSFPKEDRARIMEYAMLEGRQELFQSDPLQAKLRQICIGIRKAFDLENVPTSFRWEQYLKIPIHTGK